MDAIGGIQADALAVRLARILHHFVNVRGTEFLARAAEFFHAARIADVRILDDKVRRLVFFVLGSGVIEVRELVKG